MIVIKHIEFLETDVDPIKPLKDTPPHTPIFCGDEPVNREVLSELISGRRFVRPSDGTDIIVGVSKQAQNILGIMYEAWDNMERSYFAEIKSHGKTKIEMRCYRHMVEEIQKASFWERLKWLFRGYK